MSDDAVLAALARLEHGLTAPSADLVASLNSLDRQLAAIRDDIGINMANTQRAQKATDNTRRELRSLGDQENIMWRQMKRLEQQARDITGEP